MAAEVLTALVVEMIVFVVVMVMSIIVLGRISHLRDQSHETRITEDGGRDSNEVM